jgi:antitoxin YefM
MVRHKKLTDLIKRPKMYVYKEILTLENPQQLTLSSPLPFLKGKKVELLIIVEDDVDSMDAPETSYVLQNSDLIQQISLSLQTHQQQAGYQPTPEELNAIIGV